jgi:hypothetical protein
MGCGCVVKARGSLHPKPRPHGLRQGIPRVIHAQARGGRAKHGLSRTHSVGHRSDQLPQEDGVRPLESVDDLRGAGAFESETEEL